MMRLINLLSELVYVIDIHTYDILFMNETGMKIYGIDDPEGKKCYEVIWGSDKPCDACNTCRLKYDEFVSREAANPVANRHYLYKDKLIDWEGQEARMEIALDITELQKQKSQLKNSLEAENLVTRCVKELYAGLMNEKALDHVIEMIGRFLEADHMYMAEARGESRSTVYSWAGFEGAPYQNAGDAGLCIDQVSEWQAALRSNQPVIVRDVDIIREKYPDVYHLLRDKDIKNFAVSPVNIETGCGRYLWIDGFAQDKLVNVQGILESVSYFIASMFRYKEAMGLLEKLSYYDPLTDLRNRNAYSADIEEIGRKKNHSIGVLYTDINGLKAMNDQFGHQAGDEALTNVAEQMMKVFSGGRSYRLGGDEFVAICLDVSRDEFIDKVQELRNIFTYQSKENVATGYAWSTDASQIQRLLYEADEVMYADKKEFYLGNSGSGRYRHYMDDIVSMTQPGKLRMLLEEGRIEIYYQPKLSVEGDRLIGAEALARYRDTNGNIVTPGNFIPVLEEARLIGIVDFYVFEQVLKQIREWIRSGENVTVISVNFSRYTISLDNFAEKLQAEWEKYQIPKSHIEIEVTETVESDNPEEFYKIIRQIREYGFSVSVDDFGVRNSDLSFFAKMDFDVLKIDKSLIDSIVQSEKLQAILEAVAGICKKMGILMVAEGVENEEQLKILQRMSCDGVQGYLFSKPVTKEAFEKKYMIH